MRKVFTNREHVAWLREQAAAKRPYWYGTYYLKCTEELLNKKAKQYPGHYGAERMARYRKDIENSQICGDCVNGAIKGAVWSHLGKREPLYATDGCPDTNADGMFSLCKRWGMEWGAMDTMPDLPGVAVRYAGHVGVYVGGGEVVEWRGFAYGCVVTKLKARKWTHWYKLPWTEYVEEAAGGEETASGSVRDVGTLGARLLKRGVKGADVKTLQELLIEVGCNLSKYGADGEYGAETEAAVWNFQLAHDLTADGKYGEKTHGVMMQVLAEMAAQDEEEREGLEDEAAEEPRKKVRVTGRTVNIRKGAGTRYEIVTIVRKGAELEWVATAENGWHAVIAEGMEGWISPKYTEVYEA